MHNIPNREAYEFTYESQGTSFIFESVVDTYYNPPGTVTIVQNNTKKVFDTKEALVRMREIGMGMSVEELLSRAKALEEHMDVMRVETGRLREISVLSHDDAERAITLLGKFCEDYFFFDVAIWETVFQEAKQDEQAARKVDIVQMYKNKLRAEVDDIYFSDRGLLLSFLEKIAAAGGVSRESVDFYCVQELQDLYAGKAVSAEEIEKRKRGYVYVKTSETDQSFYSGQEAIDFAREFLREETSQETKVLKGTVAHGKGKVVQGRVRIVVRNYTDLATTNARMAAMAEGDILVSTTTDPSLMPALKKAGAIVTDIGGLLSHAAITARELDTPCIVDTKVATQILKDGDLVEVDANTGTVRIIESI